MQEMYIKFDYLKTTDRISIEDSMAGGVIDSMVLPWGQCQCVCVVYGTGVYVHVRIEGISTSSTIFEVHSRWSHSNTYFTTQPVVIKVYNFRFVGAIEPNYCLYLWLGR